MSRFLLFALLFMVTVAIIRFLRSLGRRVTQANPQTKQRNRPAASPDEIVDVTYEECESTGDEKEVGS